MPSISGGVECVLSLAVTNFGRGFSVNVAWFWVSTIRAPVVFSIRISRSPIPHYHQRMR